MCTTVMESTLSPGPGLQPFLLFLLLLPFLLLQLASSVAGQEEPSPAAAMADQPDPNVLNYHTLEELPRGTLIGSVATDAKLSERYDMSERKQLRFSFLEQPGVDTNQFAIQEVSGIITTATRIDRERLCPTEPQCNVYLDVAVGPAQFFQVLHTRIEILDVNDNRPRFPQSVIELEIPESALTGTGFTLPLAVDRDSDMNGVQKYELLGAGGKFDLAEDVTAGEVTDLKLVLTSELDRERTDFYQLRLIAHDGGTAPRSGSAIINVTVLDANDNDPVFVNSSYEVRVPENRPVNSTLVQIRAQDADLGRNARLSYSLNSRSEANYGDIFGINRRSGDLYLKSRLDYEKNKVYNLVVTVRDGGAGSPHLDQCTVLIHVLDVNDNAPQVTVNTLTESAEAEISELSGVGTFVAHISAIDRDAGRNGELSCSLDSQLFRLAQLNRNQYKIITAGALDREVRAKYTLALRCTDKGRPTQMTTKLIKVRVVDENDHVPEFDQDSYAVTIEENNPVDMFLLKLNATDRDTGVNARIKYTLADDNVRSLFSLDPDSGVLKTRASFDHERIQKMDVKVVAADQGTPPLSTSTTVMVRIVDKNDEKPQFSQPKYSFGLFENRPTHSEVGYVAATDADFSPFDRITYAFDARDASAGVFEIEPRTGLITTRQSLDREKQSAYNLWVLAYNPGYPSSTSTAAVTIHVADENDNAPVLDHPERGNATVSVSNRVPVGYVVYRVRAHDRDIGKNAKLSYAIVGGNKGRLFDVDGSSGAVTTTKDMSDIDRRAVVIRVQVRDGGEPAKTSSGFLHIIVNSSIVYSRPSDLHAEPPRPANNMIIVIVLSSASGIVLLILVIVLICIKLQTVQRRRHTYKCRPEAQRMLRSIDGKDEDSPMSKIYLPPASAANVKCKAIGRRAQAEGSSTQNVHGCVAMEEGLQRMASEHYMTNMRYSRPPSRGAPPECPYTVHHNSKIVGLTSPRRLPPADATCPPEGATPDMTFSPDRRPTKRPYPFQMCPTNDSGPKEAEMHQLLEVLRPADTESACSGDGSNPDSGRGASEHGHQELDKAESDSHSEGQQRSSVSSTESAQPFPPPPALTNPPLQRSGSSQSSGASQYPVQVSRGPDIRPHVYTELKTFSPGIHVRQPNNPAAVSVRGCGVDHHPGKSPGPGPGVTPTGTTCSASLPRLRHIAGNGTHTTTTFGTAPNGAQTITTFGTPRPRCSDGMESNSVGGGGHAENGPILESPESGHSQTTLEGRPLPMRAANVRIPEPPKPPPAVQETNLDLQEPTGPPSQPPPPQQHSLPSDTSKSNNGADITVDVLRDVTDGDTSQDSGVVDAQELCQTIDDAFFKGMVIKQKTLV